jgi:hypothetical protein
MHARELKNLGEKDERIWGVGAWRESPYFSDAERAALDLAEHVTRVADQPDPVPDTVWDNVADHYDEKELVAAALNRRDQRLEPTQRRHPATRQHRRVDEPGRQVPLGHQIRGLQVGAGDGIEPALSAWEIHSPQTLRPQKPGIPGTQTIRDLTAGNRCCPPETAAYSTRTARPEIMFDCDASAHTLSDWSLASQRTTRAGTMQQGCARYGRR